MSGEEWYPRECAYCDAAAALACRDSYCRERGFGEHRDGCGSLTDAACDCIRDEIEAQ